MKFKEINIKNRRATFDYAIGSTYSHHFLALKAA